MVVILLKGHITLATNPDECVDLSRPWSPKSGFELEGWNSDLRFSPSNTEKSRCFLWPNSRTERSSDDCHPQQEDSQTYGDTVGFSSHSQFRRAPYYLRERKFAEAKSEEQTAIGQKGSLPPSVKEPARKRKRDQESVRASGDKFSGSRAKYPKSARKGRVNKVYKKGQFLGQGGFGSVYAGTRISDGLPVALKYVHKDDEEEEMQVPGMEMPMPKEVGLFQMVNTPSSHPNILKLFDWFDRPASYVMAMERPDPCKDLYTHCQEQGGALDENQARNVTRQLLGALQHCHDHGVVHRDVKPENILIQTDTQEIKLIDFGCGDPLKDTAYTEFSGTPQYLPIEWFAKQKFLAGPGTVWSVGVTVYNIVCGGYPFNTYTSKDMRHVEFCAGLSPGVKDFILCCLRPRAKDRPTLEQLQFHPWLQQSC